MAFKAPPGSDRYSASVLSRAADLIDHGIWDIEKSRIAGWTAQFRSAEEIYLSACMLDSLIYRTRTQFAASAANLYRGSLRWECGSRISGNEDLDLLHALRMDGDPGIRLVPVINDDDPPTKSGPLVLRYIKRLLNLEVSWMTWPWKVADEIGRCPNIHTVIFVDDFLGSGSQFTGFLSTKQVPIDNVQVKWIYAPVVAHTLGVQYVNRNHPEVGVIASEYLDESHSFFDDQRWRQLSDNAIGASDACDFYCEFLKKQRIDCRGAPPLGFGELSLCLGFAHSTPDNSLPILWARGTNWAALLER
jgi:hypothetical protein